MPTADLWGYPTDPVQEVKPSPSCLSLAEPIATELLSWPVCQPGARTREAPATVFISECWSDHER